MKAMVGTFNFLKLREWAFSVIVKLREGSFPALLSSDLLPVGDTLLAALLSPLLLE